MSSAKRKDYGFVDFSTHEAAVACVDGVNKSELGDGASKVYNLVCYLTMILHLYRIILFFPLLSLLPVFSNVRRVESYKLQLLYF